MNQTHDINERAYLKIKDAALGQVIELDGGFTCAAPGKVKLEQDAAGLFFKCNKGHHYIDEQADDGIHCVGIYL